VSLLAVWYFHCYNAHHRMADWKQITARIRRARTSKDPVGQLTNLYEKTQDAMVAFELARHFETAGQAADAGKWYVSAAERFRRADWKVKAFESAQRLGTEVSEEALEAAKAEDAAAVKKMRPAGAKAAGGAAGGAADERTGVGAEADGVGNSEQTAEMLESVVALSSEVQGAEADSAATGTGAAATAAKRRRRGRRGGRNRRKAAGPATAGAGAAAGELASPAAAVQRQVPRGSSRSGPTTSRRTVEATEDEGPGLAIRRPVPPLPVEAAADFSAPSVKGRYGDPGLSSRLNLLEMQFRRLLTCEPAKLDDTVLAPVGPGVFLLSDSDLTSYYYVEACQTLRIAIGNLLRGGSSRRGAESIKPQLAEHLGIPEARVTKYLAEHCVVRWLQLDEGASHFAHFVIAVLRPTLNE
jgi:hypothetical protein